MTDDQRIAAVIPVFNKEPHVARAISSVLAQTRRVDELILIDDASTDGSLEQVRAFRDPKIRLLQRGKPGAGGYAARNLAIRHATSSWIAFLDADDSWHPYFIDEIARLIGRASSNTGCVFTGYERVWPDRPPQRDRFSAGHASDLFAPMDLDGFLLNWKKFGECPIWTSAGAFRRDVLLQAGLFPEARCRRGGDKDLWLRVMACAEAIGSPRVCATYFKGTINQVTVTTRTNCRPCMCPTVEKMIRESSGRRRRMLKQVFNQEILLYARELRQRERLSHEVYRDFFLRSAPLGYLFLLACSYVPLSLQSFARRVFVSSRTFVKELAGGTMIRASWRSSGRGTPLSGAAAPVHRFAAAIAQWAIRHRSAGASASRRAGMGSGPRLRWWSWRL